MHFWGGKCHLRTLLPNLAVHAYMPWKLTKLAKSLDFGWWMNKRIYKEKFIYWYIVFKEKKPIGLKNRGTGNDATFLGKKFPILQKIQRPDRDRYYIELVDSVFMIKPILSLLWWRNISLIAIMDKFSFRCKDFETNILLQ